MAPVTIDTGGKNAYYSAGNIGWSARSVVAYCGVINQLEAASSAIFGTPTNPRLGQSFTPASTFSLGGVRLVLLKTNTPTDNLYLEIQTDSGGVRPSGTVVATSNTINGALISTTASWHEFTFATPPSLSASTKYWIVINRSGATDATNTYTARYSTGSVYADGGRIFDTASGFTGVQSATDDLAFQILQLTPVAYYHVTQDTSLHVWKSTDNGATWTEQDSADAPTVTNANYPFDAPTTRTGPYIITGRMTAANTAAVRLFNMSTDQWDAADYGTTPPSAVSNERNIRIANDNGFVTASPGAITLYFTDSVDDADLAYQRVTASGSAWGAKTGIAALTSTEASLIADVVVDRASPGFVHRYQYNPVGDTFVTSSLSGTTPGTAQTVDATTATSETKHAPATYQPYLASGVTTVIVAYINSDDTIRERIINLDVTAASITQAAEAQISAATTSAGRQIATCRYETTSTNYAVVAVSGTGISYHTSTVAGTWSAATSFLSGGTAIVLSQVLAVPDVGVLVVYTNNGNAVIDWIVGPASGSTNATGTVSVGTAAASGVTVTASAAVSATGTVSVGTAVASGVSVTGTVSTPATGTVSVGTAAASGLTVTASAGSSATGTVTTGEAVASGLSVTGATGSTGTVTVGDAASSGLTVSATAGQQAAGTVTVGEAIASGLTVTGTADSAVNATGTVSVGEIVSSGLSVAASTGSTGAVSVGDATATGLTVTATAGTSATGTVSIGSAAADGLTVTGSSGTTGTVSVGDATASGLSVTGTFGTSVDATGSVDTGEASATGLTVTSQYGATGYVLVADGTYGSDVFGGGLYGSAGPQATGTTVTATAGQQASGTVSVGTATADGLTVTAGSSANAAVSVGTADATGLTVTATAGTGDSASVTVGEIVTSGLTATATAGGTGAVTVGTAVAEGLLIAASIGGGTQAVVQTGTVAATGLSVNATANVSASVTVGSATASGTSVTAIGGTGASGTVSVGSAAADGLTVSATAGTGASASVTPSTSVASGVLVVGTFTVSATGSVTPGTITADGYLITAGAGATVTIEPATIVASGVTVTATGLSGPQGYLTFTLGISPVLFGTLQITPALDTALTVSRALSGTLSIDPALDATLTAEPVLTGRMEIDP